MNMFAKVLLSLLATALAPLLLVTLVTYLSSQETLLAVAGDSLEASAETLAGAITASVDDAAKELESWSRLEPMQIVFTGDDQYLRISNLLGQSRKGSDFIEIWCTDLTGRVVASSNMERLKSPLQIPDSIRNPGKNGPGVGSITSMADSDGHTWDAIPISVRILAAFDDETPIGTLAGFYNWNLGSGRSARQSNPIPERGIRLFLADSTGKIIAGDRGAAPLSALLERELPALIQNAVPKEVPTHTVSETRIDGSRQIIATASVKGVLSAMDIRAVAIAPEAMVLKPARQLAAFTLSTCAAAAAVIFVLALILSRNISRPLKALSTTAQKIAEGDLDLAPPRVRGAEIGRLAAGLDTMRLSLKKQIDTLDTSVRERTGQLETSVRQLQGEIRAREEAQRQASLREQQLRQADKMVSLGILVSGVAHEINNPNGLIALNLGLLADAWEKAIPVLDEYLTEHGDFSLGPLNYSELRDQLPLILADAAAGSERIKSIVDDLKGFSRQSEERLDESVDVNQVVQSSINLVSSHIKKATHHFHVALAADLPSVRGNGRRLEQVLINLLLNACDALESTSDSIRVATFPDGEDRVIIEVGDTGRGIGEDELPRITDPFFTTRRTAGGTGLGLSVSAGIVEEHGGELQFESTPGRGTTARILLPASGQKELQ